MNATMTPPLRFPLERNCGIAALLTRHMVGACDTVVPPAFVAANQKASMGFVQICPAEGRPVKTLTGFREQITRLRAD